MGDSSLGMQGIYGDSTPAIPSNFRKLMTPLACNEYSIFCQTRAVRNASVSAWSVSCTSRIPSYFTPRSSCS